MEFDRLLDWIGVGRGSIVPAGAGTFHVLASAHFNTMDILDSHRRSVVAIRTLIMADMPTWKRHPRHRSSRGASFPETRGYLKGTSAGWSASSKLHHWSLRKSGLMSVPGATKSYAGPYHVRCRRRTKMAWMGTSDLACRKTAQSYEQDFRDVSGNILNALTESDERFEEAAPVIVCLGYYAGPLPAAYCVDAIPAIYFRGTAFPWDSNYLRRATTGVA
jgi:hypothetical protein